MQLPPREKDKLRIAMAAEVARKRLARGVKLNHPEAIALLAASPTLAHLDPAAHGSFAAGFTHPVFGLDHFLAMVALGLRPPLAAGAAVLDALALFHGHAHGAEMGGATALAYPGGFALATALLHGAGVLAGWAMARFGGAFVARASGALVAGAGAVLVLAG